MPLLFLLVGCVQSVKVGEPPAELSLSGPSVLDPWRSGSVSFEVDARGGERLEVSAVDGAGAIQWEYQGKAEDFTWDGRDRSGRLLPLGPITLVARLADSPAEPEASLELQLVDLGVLTGQLGGDRIALIWHNYGGAGRWYDGGVDRPTFGLGATHDGASPVEVPTPWDDLDRPPDPDTLTNMPAAYAWDARPTLSLGLGPDAGGGVTPAIEGWTLVEGEVGPNALLVFQKDEALANGPDVVEPELSLEFRSSGRVVARVAVPLRIYALLGEPTFESSELPYGPWVAVIDPLLRSISGVTPDREQVTSAVVDHIYDELGLAYDTQAGASAYAFYQRFPYDDAHLDLSSFLYRRFGSIINCSDCAALVEAFSNMIGAEAYYSIITPSFDLNEIKAIGADAFTNCPFGRGGCGFSYHAVVTGSLDTEVIYDATLVLDGDDDPGDSPSTELRVHALYADVYLDRLVRSGRPSYRYTQSGTLQ